MFDLSTIKAKNRQAALQFTRSEKTRGTLKALAEMCLSTRTRRAECPHCVERINDFVVTSLGPNGGLLVTPTNDGAKLFLRNMFAFSEDYRGASVVIKHRNWPSILWLIQAGGMTASRK